LWEPRPNLEIAGAAWIHAGGAHHSAYTQGVTLDQLSDFAEMCGVELVVIGADTDIRSLKQELRHNDVYYRVR
jgi:L-arabinose isomerase